ncbi:MAG: hypothetical protein V4608_09030 [Bacteroidota bacterium]
MKKRLLFSIASVCVFLGTGCGNSAKEEGSFSEGVITYAAEPVNMDDPMAAFAPSEMTVKFKNNNSAAQMSAGIGALDASFVSDLEARTFTQIIRLFSDKYFVIQNEAEIKKENESFDLEIEPTKETKVIAGYICKKAIVHQKGDEPTDFDIYYTNELKIENSNFSNPYYKLDGVLMEYRMKKFGLEMKFTTTGITKEKVDDAVFEIPENYEEITQEALLNKLKFF